MTRTTIYLFVSLTCFGLPLRAQVVDLFTAIFEEAGISHDLQTQPKDDFRPAASTQIISSIDDDVLAGRAAIATLMTAGQAAAKRTIEREEAVRNNDFLAFLLGKKTADKLYAKQQYDDFMIAHKVYIQDCKDAKAWDDTVGAIIRQRIEGQRNSPQHAPQKPKQRQKTDNNDHARLNNRFIAACHANDMESASLIAREMHDKGIPLSAAANAAMSDMIDREVAEAVAPLEQSLWKLR